MKRSLRPEDLFEIRLSGSVTPLPDGRVVYVEARPDQETNDTVSRLRVLGPDAQVADFTRGPRDTTPRLSPDGRLLAFLSKRSRFTQVWVMDTEGGEARQLTRAERGVRSFAWAPSGDCLAFLTHEGREVDGEAPEDDRLPAEVRGCQDVHITSSRQYRQDGEGFFPARPPQIALVDLAGRSRAITEVRGRITDLTFSGDGRTVRFIAHLSDDQDVDVGEIYEVGTDGGDVRPLLVRPDLSAKHLVFTPGAGTLFIVSETSALDYDNPTLALLAEGGDLLRLATALDRPVGNATVGDLVAPPGPSVVVEEGANAALALITTGGTTQIGRIPLDGSPAEILTKGDHTMTSFAPVAGGFVVSLQTSDVISEIFRIDGTEATRLTRSNAALEDAVELGAVRRFEARSEDGTAVDAWLVLPPRASGASGPLPAVLQIHGGPMMQYARSVMFEHQLISAQGIAVIASNPRGSVGYGRAFAEAIKVRWGDLDDKDLKAVTDQALRLETRLDGTRLGVAGGSYGGYMTNWIIGHTDRFKAAHTMRSVVDWRSMSGTSDLYWTWVQRSGAYPWEDETFAREQSPITYVGNITTPLLIEHQEGDLRCPIEQAEILYAALKMLGRAPVVFVRYPDEFHGMSRNGKPWHRVHRLELIRDWWRHSLLGEAPAGALVDHL